MKQGHLTILDDDFAADEDEVEQRSIESVLAGRVVSCTEQGQHRAALAAAVELVNHIAAERGLSGGAFL